MAADQFKAIGRILSAPTAHDADEALLGLARTVTGASAGSMYVLNLGSGEYDLLVSHATEARSIRVPAHLTELMPVHEMRDLLSIAARTREPHHWSVWDPEKPSRYHSPLSRSRAVYPLIRSKTAIGLLDVEAYDALPEADPDLLALLSILLGELIDRRATDQLLARIQEPLDLTATRHEYFKALAALVHRATGFEFVALREGDANGLECVGEYGFGDRSLRSLDLAREAIAPPFLAAVERQETGWRSSIADADLADLKAMGALRHVQGFMVTPLYVGTDTTGALSVATRCFFEPSYQRVDAFRALGNAVALAIENFKNFHSTTGEIQELVTAAHSALSTVIMQSTRHSALGHLGQAQAKLALVVPRIKADAKATRLVGEASDAVEAGKNALALQRHRSIVDPKTRDPEEIRLDRLIEDVHGLVDGQLIAGGIGWRVNVGALEAYVIPDILPIAFLQLVENSIEAYGAPGARSDSRLIQWTADDIDGRRVRLTYSDNATGINPRRLKVPSTLTQGAAERDWKSLLFEPGVTSKEEGTGWGLYYVRLLIDRAAAGQPNGIDLADWVNGVSFRIELPRRPT